jgi:hypothetical protein
MTIINPYLLFVLPALTADAIGWEAISTAHKSCPDDVAAARLARDEAEEAWLALTDQEPLPYTEISAAFEHLRQTEAVYFAARARWEAEKAARCQETPTP